MAKDTKLSLNNQKVVQSNSDKLSLSGLTEINGLSANTFSVIKSPLDGVAQDFVLVRDDTTGEIKHVAQQDLDVRNPSLQVFYVDSNNPKDGDGSIINPFKSLDLAYNEVIGGGTAALPENQNITISVAGGTYSTAINIAANTLTWVFQEGSIVNYTGNDYLFDISVFGTSNTFCNVYGSGEFITDDGGIINAIGTNISGGGNSRTLRFRCNLIRSNVNNGTTGGFKPVIICENPTTTSTNGQGVLLYFSVNESVRSANQTIFRARNNPRFVLDGSSNVAFMQVARFGLANPAPDAHIFDIGDTFEGLISNFRVFAYTTDAYIKIGQSGNITNIGRIEIKNIVARTSSSTSLQAQRFMQIGDIVFNTSSTFTEARIILSNIDYVENYYVDKLNYIQYIGTNSTFNNLELYNSRLPYPIDSNINLNKEIITTNSSVSGGSYINIQAENTIGGKFNISNVTGGTGEVLLVDENGYINKIDGSGGGLSGERIQKTITQTSHGFVVGDIVGVENGVYLKSLSVVGQPEPLGIVTEIISADEFVLVYAGYTDKINSMTDDAGLQLVANTIYYVSDSIAGKLTTTEPSQINDISKPILYVIDSIGGNVLLHRGFLIGGESSGNDAGLYYTGATISGDSITTDFTVNHGFNTRDVLIQVYEDQVPYTSVIVDTDRTDLSTVTVSFSNAPNIGVNYRVLIFSAVESAGGSETSSGFGDWINIGSLSNEITNTQIPLQYRFDNDPDSEIVYFRGQFGRNINSIDRQTWIIGNLPSNVRPTYDYITYREKGDYEYKVTVEASTGNIIINSVSNTTLPVTNGGVNDPNPYQINDMFYRPNNPYNVELSDSQHFIGYNPDTYNGAGTSGSQTATVTYENVDSSGARKNTIRTYDFTVQQTKIYNDGSANNITSSLNTFGNNTSIRELTYNQDDNTHVETQLLITNSEYPIYSTFGNAVILWDAANITEFTTSPQVYDVFARSSSFDVGFTSPDTNNVTLTATATQVTNNPDIEYSIDGGATFNSFLIATTVGDTANVTFTSAGNDDLRFRVNTGPFTNDSGTFDVEITNVTVGTISATNTVTMSHTTQ